MAQRTPVKQSEHDAVVQEATRLWDNARQRGYEVTTNPGSDKNRSVGTNGHYPDIVVWKPSHPGSTSGTASTIAEVETEDSVNDSEAKQWATYAGLGVYFVLIVPKGAAPLAASIVDRVGIRVNEIWMYEARNGGYAFAKYR